MKITITWGVSPFRRALVVTDIDEKFSGKLLKYPLACYGYDDVFSSVEGLATKLGVGRSTSCSPVEKCFYTTYDLQIFQRV